MTCKSCKTNPVFNLPNSNIYLCISCFNKYFEKNVFKTIRQFNLVDKNDNIAVAVSGGKDSLSLLYILNKITSKNKNIKLIPILIDEGIKDYRDKTIKDAKKLCKQLNLKLNILSYKKEFGYTLDQLLELSKEKPCSVCGVLRRYLLNKYARKLKTTKIATGHNLDDESQAIVMNQFRNNPEVNARLGPITGIKDNPLFIRRIKPFYFLTEKETTAYAYLHKFTSNYNSCPYTYKSYRGDVRNMLNSFEQNHPGIKNSIIKSFIEILPLLKKKYSSLPDTKSCKKCKEPCSGEICQCCNLINNIQRKK
ncbi:TIGR00269 family protein [Candidatus Woesearchaeota archaeon]|nr:TIGR00269 family protein [Candidatus Woesearchaeota archaeon]